MINATHEAETLHHAQVQPEHLLLSLLSPESGTAWNVLAGTLRNPAVMQEGLRIVLADATPASEATSPEYGFRIKRTLSEAEDEARRAGHEQVDTSHMLLGLLDEGGAAGQMLRRNGFDAARLRHWLRQPNTAAAPVAEPMVSKPVAVKPLPAIPKTRDERLARLESQPLKQILPRLISWPAVGVMLGLLIVSAIVTGASDYNRGARGASGLCDRRLDHEPVRSRILACLHRRSGRRPQRARQWVLEFQSAQIHPSTPQHSSCHCSS